MNCWRCNGTGWYGGVDGNHFECNHPPDTREYTDKGYLIMGIVNKYDEALEKLELLRLRASSHVDISNCKKTMQDWIDSDAEFIKESLTKAKAFDQIVEAINYEFLHARHVDNWPYGSDEKHNLKIRATAFWNKINTRLATLEKQLEGKIHDC